MRRPCINSPCSTAGRAGRKMRSACLNAFSESKQSSEPKRHNWSIFSGSFLRTRRVSGKSSERFEHAPAFPFSLLECSKPAHLLLSSRPVTEALICQSQAVMPRSEPRLQTEGLLESRDALRRLAFSHRDQPQLQIWLGKFRIQPRRLIQIQDRLVIIAAPTRLCALVKYRAVMIISPC